MKFIVKLKQKIFGLNVIDIFILLAVCVGVIFVVKRYQKKRAVENDKSSGNKPRRLGWL